MAARYFEEKLEMQLFLAGCRREVTRFESQQSSLREATRAAAIGGSVTADLANKQGSTFTLAWAALWAPLCPFLTSDQEQHVGV